MATCTYLEGSMAIARTISMISIDTPLRITPGSTLKSRVWFHARDAGRLAFCMKIKCTCLEALGENL